jgi:hypothetical protein
MEEMHVTMAKEYHPLDFCIPAFTMTDKFVIEVMEKCDAIWVHNGDPKKPHAKLTSGKCSNGFFNCLKALKYINLNEIFAFHLAAKIREEIGNISVDWVIGSPMAGITFSYAVARHLGAGIHFFTEKDPESDGGMLWKREVIPEGDSVLQIEELITTLKTTNNVQVAIDRDNPYPVNWLPAIGVYILRPEELPLTHCGDRKIVSIFEREVWSVDPLCELCKKGSEPIRAKTNWAELTAR